MTIFAYLRVSTDDQNTENQKLQITKQGFTIDQWYSENGVSGKVNALQRPVFAAMMEAAQAEDTICVLTLDRLGRNTEDILATIRRCTEKGVKLRVMALDGTDLTSKSGKILTVLMSLIAELERDDISTRTKAGLARTKAEGTVLGRSLKVSPSVLKDSLKGRQDGKPWAALAEKHGVDKNTLLQTCAKWNGKIMEYEVVWQKQQEQLRAREAVEEN